MNAARRQVATISPRWLNAWCSNSTTPASGRERDARTERTIERARIVSPWNTGLGNSTLFMPRLAMVVPRVVSPTDMPIIRPEREQRIDDALAEFGGLRELLVQMQRLRVQRERAEQHVVHLGDGAAERVLEGLAFVEVLEIQAGHDSPSPRYTNFASNGGIRSGASNSSTQMSGSNLTCRAT